MIKNNNLKRARPRIHRQTEIKITANFMSETMQARRNQEDIIKVWRRGPRILYAAKSSFKSKGEIKIYLDKQKLRLFFSSRPVLQEKIKEVLQAEKKYQMEILINTKE